MELEQMVQLVTDRLIEKLHASDQPTLAVIGEQHPTISAYYKEKGYQNITGHFFLTADVLLVTELSLFSLTRLAQLLPQGKDEQAILQQLLQNKNLYVLEDGLELSKKRSVMNQRMLTEFDKAKLTLQKWGATFVSKDYFEDKPTGRQPVSSVSPVKKELITVAKVQALSLSKEDVFYVTPNMIVTALAKDYLKDKEIHIEKRKH